MYSGDYYLIISEFSKSDLSMVNKSSEINGKHIDYTTLESHGYADVFDGSFNHLGKVMVVNQLIEKTDWTSEKVITYLHEDEDFFDNMFRQKYGSPEEMSQEEIGQYVSDYPIKVSFFSIFDGVLHTSFDYHVSMWTGSLTYYVESFVNHLGKCFVADVMYTENDPRDDVLREESKYYNRTNSSILLQLYRENIMLKWKIYKEQNQ